MSVYVNQEGCAVALQARVIRWHRTWGCGSSQFYEKIQREAKIVADFFNITVIPNDAPDTLIKFNRYCCRDFSAQKESTAIKRVQAIRGTRFILPKTLCWGANPDCLQMTYLDRSFDSRTHFAPQELERIGLAVGEFAGILYRNHGEIHTDIVPKNVTDMPKGLVGILDLNAVRKTTTPEDMFLLGPILHRHFSIAPYIAVEFEAITGHKLSLDKMRERVRSTAYADATFKQERLDTIDSWEPAWPRTAPTRRNVLAHVFRG